VTLALANVTFVVAKATFAEHNVTFRGDDVTFVLFSKGRCRAAVAPLGRDATFEATVVSSYLP
jgi:hypothetical protein